MTNQDKQHEIEMFDSLYGNVQFSESPEEDYTNLYSRLFKDINPKNGIKLLDVGCGPGIHSIRLAKIGFEVYGIDISEKAIELAKRKAEELNTKVSFIVGDIENLPFKTNSFDVVFCGTVLHHFPDLSKVSSELYRVTKTNGKLVSYDPNGLHPYGFIGHNFLNKIINLKYFSKNERALYPNELERLFEKVGFIEFNFSTILMRTTKKSPSLIKMARSSVYYLSDKLLWGLHKGPFLIMECKK